MRHYSIILLLTFAISCLGAQNSSLLKESDFNLKGKLSGLKEGSKVYLSHKYNDKVITDSTSSVKGGNFNFKGTTPESNMYWIQLAPNSKSALIFFIDGGKVTVEGTADSIAFAKVKGGTTQDDYVAYGSLFKSNESKKQEIVNKFNAAQSKGDMKTMEEMRSEYESTEKNLENEIRSFIKARPRSAVAAYAIFASFQNNPSIKELEELYNLLDPELHETKFGKLAQERIDKVRGTSVGYKAIDFSQNDVNGNPVTLSSYQGKYVLVDFWASWCGPCRAENPNVVEAYNAFKDKGFDILGVSLDSTKDKWLKAIEKDKLTWTHVSDLKGWSNEVAVKYGISSIPANLLLDKDGKILAKNLRGEELKAKLAELLK